MSVQLKNMVLNSDDLSGHLENPVLTNILSEFTSELNLYGSQSLLIPAVVIVATLKILAKKDMVSFHHSIRCGQYMLMLAQWLDLSPDEAQEAYLVALLHDIGKVGIPDDILTSTSELSLKEFSLMKKHPVISAEILEAICDEAAIIEGVRYHHERVDGYGYPEGRVGNEIPKYARMTLIVDTFDAMTSDRHYQVGLPYDIAIREIAQNAGKQFDREMAQVFVTRMSALIKKMESRMGIDKLPRVGGKKAA